MYSVLIKLYLISSHYQTYFDPKNSQRNFFFFKLLIFTMLPYELNYLYCLVKKNYWLHSFFQFLILFFDILNVWFEGSPLISYSQILFISMNFFDYSTSLGFLCFCLKIYGCHFAIFLFCQQQQCVTLLNFLIHVQSFENIVSFCVDLLNMFVLRILLDFA